MTFPNKKSLLRFALMFSVVACPPAWAASSAASSASEGSSASVGSSSTSLETSSHSSTHNDRNDVAQGDYRITEVATLPERPDMARLKLQLVADAGPAGELLLYLPQETFDQTRLSTGKVVTARHRPYGVEFASGPAHTAFFLVLDDAWYRELQTHPVVL